MIIFGGLKLQKCVSSLLMLSIAICGYTHTHGETVEYTVNNIVFKGYLAYDDQIKTKRQAC